MVFLGPKLLNCVSINLYAYSSDPRRSFPKKKHFCSMSSCLFLVKLLQFKECLAKPDGIKTNRSQLVDSKKLCVIEGLGLGGADGRRRNRQTNV